VTDFGLAKTGDTGMTHTGDILGTIRYMSPERFRGQCDVRADVYALGMTLYELLTLKAAYVSGDRLKLMELIRSSEPASPRSIDARIPRDLETIVMKAIDKDVRRRYQSADEMAEDLQRFVNDEPIKARRIGSAERLGRWCRRNPAVAGLMAAVLLLMAAGTAVSTWQAVVANRARAELAAKNDELTDEQAKVQARFDMAMKAIALFHTGVSEDMLLKNAKFQELRTKLLKEAAGFYTELEKLLAGQTDTTSRKTLADGYSQLALLTAKIGDQQQALAVHRKALALRRELAAAPGADVETRLEVARSLDGIGQLLRAMGDHAGALATSEEYRDLAERLEAEHPSDAVRFALAQSYEGITFVLQATGKLEAALTPRRQALAIFQKLTDANPAVTEFQYGLAKVHHLGGGLLARTGKPEEGLTEYRQALAIWQKLVDANRANTEFQSGLAWSRYDVGLLLRQTGKPEEALTEYRQALAIWQKLADANRANTEFQFGLAWSHDVVGEVLAQTGKPEEGLTEYRQAVAIFQKVADANPANTEFQSGLAWSHNLLGRVLSQTGKPEEALTEFRKTVAIFQKVADANPANTEFQRCLAWSQVHVGRLLARQKRFAEALTVLDASLAIGQNLADADPTNELISRYLGYGHAFRGGARVLAGQPAEAAADLRKALELWAKIQQPDIGIQVERARALANLAGLGADARSGVTADEAKAFADQSVAGLTAVVKTGWAIPGELKEPDFNTLRGRADFQKLVAEVAARAEKPLATAPLPRETK
jgi:tetratricopeptide (TPR) repeat protein